MSNTACQISGIVKSFGPNKVLQEINLELPAGMITVLMGANGAGKSTLVKILCGVHQADAGSVYLLGERFEPVSPADAFKSGVVTVHQSINNGVIPDLDVASNLMIDKLAEQNSGFFINSEKLKKEADKIPSGKMVKAGVVNENAGYVYVIRDMDSGLYKIGETSNWRRRFKELKVDDVKIVVIQLKWVSNRFEIEKYHHDLHRDYRLPQSEWFKLSKSPMI